MTECQDVLVPSLRGNTSVEPPYSNAQISETVTHREILRIYRMARPETRVVYDLGRDTARLEEENWVIRWMLWHVFRYRDSRNKNRRPNSPCEDRSRCSNTPSISSISSRGHAPTSCEYCLLVSLHWNRQLEWNADDGLQIRPQIQTHTVRAAIGTPCAINGASDKELDFIPNLWLVCSRC